MTTFPSRSAEGLSPFATGSGGHPPNKGVPLTRNSQIWTTIRTLAQPASPGCRVNPAFMARKGARGIVEGESQQPPESCQDPRTVEASQLDADFTRRIQKAGGPDLSRCYQCLTCTLGCPVVSDMDHQPHALVRMVQLGLREQVLCSRTIWLCAGCETCATRCPNDIEVVKLMDALRQMALCEGIQATEPAVAAFHRTFLEGIRCWGRQYELGMMLALKVRTLDLFGDIGLGLKMLLKGKLALLPHRSHVSKEVKVLFHRTEKS